MLDQKLCSTPSLVWTNSTQVIAEILFTPKIIIAVIILFFGSYFCLSLFRLLPKPRQRLTLAILISLLPLLLSLLLTSSPFLAFADAQLMNFPVADSDSQADGIVILGRGAELRASRVKVATELWRSHRAPQIFASGRGDATEIQEMLKAMGIPDHRIGGEDCSRTTEENAEFTALVLQPLGVKTIFLVTDPPHMRRSLLTFQRYGFKAIAAPSLIPSDLAHQTNVFLTIREFMAMTIYRLQGRLATN